MRALALDLGTTTGWAVTASGHVTSGTTEFKPNRFEGGGMRYLKFKNWLSVMKGGVGTFDMVLFEEVRNHSNPSKKGGRSFNVDAAHAYGGFLASLTAWCEAEAIPYLGVPVGTIKKHATGKGNASKEQMIAAMRKKGHPNLEDDNEADALAILYYGLEVLAPALAVGTLSENSHSLQGAGSVAWGPPATDIRLRRREVKRFGLVESCGSCSYEEADGSLIAQCAKCLAKSGKEPKRERRRIQLP